MFDFWYNFTYFFRKLGFPPVPMVAMVAICYLRKEKRFS